MLTTTQGKHSEAKDVLDMLSTTENPQERTRQALERYQLIAHVLAEEESQGSHHWSDIFRQGPQKIFQRTVLGIIGLCMLQLSGINLITYYACVQLQISTRNVKLNQPSSPVIFQDTIGMSRNTSLLVSGINGLEYWLATFIPIPLIDRIGRRPILLFGAIGQTITMALLAAMTADRGNAAKGYVAAVLLL